jgi:hypothetical protein
MALDLVLDTLSKNTEIPDGGSVPEMTIEVLAAMRDKLVRHDVWGKRSEFMRLTDICLAP